MIADTIIAVSVVLVALAGIAAAARKPPLSWLLRHLIGDPFNDWLDGLMEDRVKPIVRDETAMVLAAHMHEEEGAMVELISTTANIRHDLVKLTATVEKLKPPV